MSKINALKNKILVCFLLFIISVNLGLCAFAKGIEDYRIVYVISKPHPFSENVKEDIYLIDTDGIINKLTFDGINISPNISRDGGKIVFIKKDGKQENELGNIYIVDYNGKNVKQLTSSGKCSNPIFTPNGKSIIFVENKTQIYLISINGEDKNKLYELSTSEMIETTGKNITSIGQIRVSDDGSKIYFLQQRGVLTAGNGYMGEVKGLYISGKSCYEIELNCENFALAGQKIVFTFPEYSGYCSIYMGKIPINFKYGPDEKTDICEKIKNNSSQVILAHNLDLKPEGDTVVYDTLGGFREKDYQTSNIFLVNYSDGKTVQLTFDNVSWNPSISGKVTKIDDIFIFEGKFLGAVKGYIGASGSGIYNFITIDGKEIKVEYQKRTEVTGFPEGTSFLFCRKVRIYYSKEMYYNNIGKIYKLQKICFVAK